MIFSSDDIAKACDRCANAMRSIEDSLDRADGMLGDGDTGQTMRRLSHELALHAETYPNDIGVFIRSLGLTGMNTTGSSLGTLVSLGLVEMGKALRGRQTITLQDVPTALGAAEAAMLSRGETSLGDKTALDLLHSVIAALAPQPSDSAEAVIAACEAALDEFRDRACQRGRARMFSERSVGLDDPGMLAFAALARAIVSVPVAKSSPQSRQQPDEIL